MKIAKFFITAYFIGFLILPLFVLAHPGRTDRRGGHYCRTNCKKWGLRYRQYHYHYRNR